MINLSFVLPYAFLFVDDESQLDHILLLFVGDF